MSGLNSILPKPRTVSRSAKQRFLERAVRRHTEAEKFFEARAEEQTAALTAAYVERTVHPGAAETPHRPAGEAPCTVKKSVHEARVPSITAEALLSELD